MLKQAVKNHHTATPVQPVPPRQQSLAKSLNRTQSSQKTPSARPLSTLSANGTKHNAAADRGLVGQIHGIKRTSSGLAKALGSQEEFDYPSLSISDIENEPLHSFRPAMRNSFAPQAPVAFDEDDFDSDIDLEVEDPSERSTVQYPTLPQTGTASRDSTYFSATTPAPDSKPMSDSSQPVPWSSSPPEHYQPLAASVDNAPAPPPTKRRTLPWQQGHNRYTASQLDKYSYDPESEAQTPRPTKRRATSAARNEQSTPAPKENKPAYSWNITQSALKQQQKSLREANKKAAKTSDSAEDVTGGIFKRKETIARIFLTEEQQHVLNLVVEHKKSVFFTGSAGTGKSVLLREIIGALRRKFIREPDRVAVTASTGLAACNVGGVTLHSFAGIGLGKEPAEDLVKRIRRNAKAKMRWLRTKVLIVDEVSMVDGELFDKLEQIARTIRNNGRPFGGIQLVITGDFFQLPPVPERGRIAKFAFDAGTWTTSIEHTIGLHHVFRQKDPTFAGMLNEMREGRLTPASISAFRKLDRPLPKTDDNIEATELFPLRTEVDRANEVRMNQLQGQTYTFTARDAGTITDKERRDQLLASCIVPETVHLKKGAQVMLVKNMDDTLVNGSLGKVTHFMTPQMFEVYKENEEAFLAGEGGSTEREMRSKLGEKLLGLTTQQLYPVVRFAIADGTTRDLLCQRESWKVELPNGEVQASREQIPLILAWALSIHKAQGQTLERVRVNLGRVFEKGQAYVALSRATSMAGLQVLGFDPKKVLAHEKVRSFYSSLSRAEQVETQPKAGPFFRNVQKTKRKTDG